jgi:hypothetical protein
MEDRPEIVGSSAENPESEGEGRTRCTRAWIASIVVALVATTPFTLPLLATRIRIRSMPSGSYEYARQWKTQLLACQSLDDVKQHFNCIAVEPREGGGARRVEVTAKAAGRTEALIASFPDGKWIACAYADSHGAGDAAGGRSSRGIATVSCGCSSATFVGAPASGAILWRSSTTT